MAIWYLLVIYISLRKSGRDPKAAPQFQWEDWGRISGSSRPRCLAVCVGTRNCREENRRIVGNC